MFSGRVPNPRFIRIGKTSTSGKHRTKTRLAQDARDLRAFVALNLDPPFLDRAARAASFLHRLGEALFFRQTDADETLDHRHGLSAAMGRLPQNVHPAAVLPRRRRVRCWLASRLAALILGSGRESRGAQSGEWILTEALIAADGNPFLSTHDIRRDRGNVTATLQ